MALPLVEYPRETVQAMIATSLRFPEEKDTAFEETLIHEFAPSPGNVGSKSETERSEDERSIPALAALYQGER